MFLNTFAPAKASRVSFQVVSILPGHIVQLAIVKAKACGIAFVLDQDNHCRLRVPVLSPVGALVPVSVLS